jgi:hypothetical protein
MTSGLSPAVVAVAAVGGVVQEGAARLAGEVDRQGLVANVAPEMGVNVVQTFARNKKNWQFRLKIR